MQKSYNMHVPNMDKIMIIDFKCCSYFKVGEQVEPQYESEKSRKEVLSHRRRMRSQVSPLPWKEAG